MNVVALRYQVGGPIFNKSILTGRSHCPYCQRTLQWYELVPVFSFLIQFGKCRHCKHNLTWQYPIVELLSGLTFVFVPGFIEPVPIGILVVLTLILITLIDLRLLVIPDQLTGFLAVLGLAVIALFPAHQNITYKIIGAALGLAIFGLIILLTRGRGMGMGDLKLAGVLGLLFGWPKIILIASLAFVIGGIWAAILLLTKKKSLKDAIPFGPFLAIAAVVVILIGDKLINFYSQYLL